MDWHIFTDVFFKPLFTVGDTAVSIASLIKFVVMVSLVMLIARMTRRLVRTQLLGRTKLDIGKRYAISRIVSYVVLVLGLAVGVQTLGVDISSLMVLAGALGVGIGFGLQNVVNNFVSGLILLSDRVIQVGDRIEVGNTTGKILQIGARATSICTNDNIVIIVPNSEFVSGRVVNWSHGGDLRVRIRVPVSVAYGSDPRQVERLLLEAAAENTHALKEPAPIVVFKQFGESSMDFELRVWTTSMTHRPGVFKSDLNFAICDKFKLNGISIPFPQRDLHLKEPIRVEVSKTS